MAETKYGKYIITEVKANLFLASGENAPKREESVVVNLDDSVIKGAFLVQAAWVIPSDLDFQKPVQPHTHDFDEVLGQFGTDLKNPHDLCAELEIWLGGEKHIITRSSIIFIPKGLAHGPIKFNRIDKPIFHFTCGKGQQYKPLQV
jgi:hypothetical protein